MVKNLFTFSIGVLLCASFGGVSHAKDTLRLKNGDILSGQITQFSMDGVRLDAPYGTFDIEVGFIGGIESPRYHVEDLQFEVMSSSTIDDPILAALDPSGVPSHRINTKDIPPVPVSDAVSNTETDIEGQAADDKHLDLWGADWSGEVNAGAEFQTGNSDSETLSLDGETTANWDDIHRATIGADYTREEENDIKVEDEQEVYAAYDYFFAEKWFWNNTASFKQDNVDNLDSRIEAASGLGYQFYNRDDLSLEATLGPGYQREKYEDQDAQTNMTANWTFDYEQAFYDDFVRLFHAHALTTPMDDMSLWLFESESGIKVPLRAGIVATSEINFDYNNNAPNDVEEEDTTYRIKLGYEWP